MRQEDDRQLWTGWLDYEATGEGRTITACICYATSEEQLRDLMCEKYGSWFSENCEVAPGLVTNEVVRYLWSEKALAYFERVRERRGKLEAYNKVHVNFS